MFEGKRVYSLGVDIYETDFKFRELEKKLSELAGESFSTKPESFKLIKENRKGRRMVYIRVLTNSFGIPSSIFDEEDKYCMDFEDTTNTPFYGKCRIIISYAFKGRTKVFKITAENITIIRTDK